MSDEQYRARMHAAWWRGWEYGFMIANVGWIIVVAIGLYLLLARL